MTVRLLHDLGHDLKGAVIEMSDDRAQRLIAMGYVVQVRTKTKKEQD